MIYLTALELLKEQLQSARELFSGTVADITTDQLHEDPGGKAFPLGATYAHLVFSEDVLVQQMIQHKEPLFKSSMKNKTGADKPMPEWDANWETTNHEWSKTVKIDLEMLKEYEKAVYTATDEYLSSISDEDLDHEVDMGEWGKYTIAKFLSNFIIGHLNNLTGEISVLKGVQGVKGYPF